MVRNLCVVVLYMLSTHRPAFFISGNLFSIARTTKKEPTLPLVNPPQSRGLLSNLLLPSCGCAMMMKMKMKMKMKKMMMMMMMKMMMMLMMMVMICDDDDDDDDDDDNDDADDDGDDM